MDVAALALNIDSNPVEQAIDRLDRFAASADRASAAAKKITGSGSTAKLGQDYDRAARAADQASGSIMRIADSVVRSNAAMTAATSASAALRAANDNTGRSFQTADAHVQAYTKHLQSMGAALQQADAHVKAYRNSLSQVNATGQQANAHILAYRNQLVTASEATGTMRANTANLAAQFQDIGVTAAMGMNPLLIALQQGTQLSAVLAQSGGSAFSTIGAAIRQVLSPVALLTIGLVALIAYAAQLAIEFFNASSESEKLSETLDKVQFATDAVGTAQSILGGVMDMTTGKINTQSTALIALARAQLLVARVQAQVRAQEARTALRENEEWRPGRGSVFLRQLTNPFERRDQTEAWRQGQRAPGADVIANFNRGADFFASLEKPTKDQERLMGQLADSTVKNLDRMRAAGQISAEEFAKLASNVANYAAETTQMKVWDDAQRLLDGDRNGTGYLLDPAKASRSRRGGKTEAERLADFIRQAKDAIEVEEARGKAAEMSAMQAAELEQRTKLLNQAEQSKIRITPKLTAEIDKLSEAYAKAKVNADVSEVIKKSTDDIQSQRDAVADQTKLIGLYGDALARARREMEAQRKLSEGLPRGEIAVVGNLTGSLSDDIEANARAERLEKVRRESEVSAYAMELERRSLGLTGAAALEYAFIAERLIEAKRAGIELSPAEVAAINAAGEAYANQRYAIDQQARAIADAREVARGFFTDWITGMREGGNAVQAFADAATAALNRIIDKLLDRALDGFLSSLFPTAAATLPGTAGGMDLRGFALGGAFDRAQRFANGGTFTNQIVTQPTLFRFAKGAQLGEMGEAGPEAIMPLKRGPNGALGVQATGGGPRKVEINLNNEYKLDGAIGPDSIVAMIRQGNASTEAQIKRNLESWLREWDNDGAVSV